MALNFIFEGLEAAGKSMHTALLAETLEKTTDFPIMAVREPGGTKIGSMIRHMLLESEEAQNMLPTTRMLQYSSDRNELIKGTILPFNKKHPDGITIGDRSWPSTLALQLADGADKEFTELVQEHFIKLYPHKIFLLDIHEEESVVRLFNSRWNGRKMNWRDEMPVETYREHRRNYLDLAKKYPEKFVLVDGFKPPWEIIQETWRYVLTEMTKQSGLEARAKVAIENYSGLKFDPIAAEIKEKVSRRFLPDSENLFEQIESARKELNARSQDILRAEMHEDWRKLGFETSVAGIERGK